MDLVNRLKFFMDSQNIGISQFADSCMIPRPTMSQILNGRNKKISDELITKIHVAYPQLSVLWLMFNEGPMVMNENTRLSEPQNAHSTPHITQQASENEPINISNSAIFNNDASTQNSNADVMTDKNAISAIQNATSTLSPAGQTQYIDFGTNGASPDIPYHNNEMSENDCLSFPTTDFEPQVNNMRVSETPETESVNNMDGIAVSPVDSDTDSIDTSIPPKIPANPSSQKKITNIVVFYSDNSFQTFGPA